LALGPRPSLLRPLPLLAALALFAVITALTPLRALDLDVYLAAAERVFVLGTEPYTRPGDAGLPFTYPPTALFLLQPLAGLSSAAASALLWSLNIALALVLMLLLPRDLARGGASADAALAGRRLATWGPLYVAGFGAVYLTIHFQQINLLLLLCLWGYWRIARAPSGPGAAGGLAGGAALALGSVAKPHYGLLVVAAFGCLGRRASGGGWRAGPGAWLLAGAALAGAALLGLSVALAPAGSWSAWWALVPGTTSFTELPPGHSSIAAPWNRSLAGELSRWLVPNKFTAPVVASPELAALFATGLVLALGLITGWAVTRSLRARRCGQTLDQPVAVDLELSLLSVWVFLAAPASWTHHLVMLLPAALVLLRDGVLHARTDAVGRLAAGLVLAVLALTLDDLIPREVRTDSRAIMALMTVAVLGLWALLLERLVRHTAARRRAAAEP
jgi:hypothetical protein